MKYYKLSMDMSRKNDIVCHYEEDFGIQQNEMCIGKVFNDWSGEFTFAYDENEGHIATDYLANDKGWFVISEKLKKLLEKMNTEIQFFPVKVVEKQGAEIQKYYVANILKVVDALCLDKSEYFETEISGLGTIYTVSKFAVYEEKVKTADVFKLANKQEIPIFVSERFKEMLEINDILGVSLKEIRVV